MKMMSILLIGGAFFAGCSPRPDGEERYGLAAQWATDALLKHYWNDGASAMNNAYPYAEEREGHPNYWWKAHAVDAMVDAYERTGDEAYAEKAALIVKSIIKRNGSLYNDFYDDMEWLALSALRLYDATGDETMKGYVLKLWGDIQTAWWEDELGGMAWKKDQRHSRNACSNGPAAILAARLYDRFGDEADLAWAKKIYEWEKTNLVDPASGLVYDGLVLEDDGRLNVNRDWIFTYNNGTFIGAAVELYKITGDEAYLADAEKTAAAAIPFHSDDATGVMKSEGTGDGGLFKGILLRYLANLYEAGGSESIRDAIFHNADALLTKGSAQDVGLFGTAWDRPPEEPVDLTVQLSGVFLLEAAAKLERLEAK